MMKVSIIRFKLLLLLSGCLLLAGCKSKQQTITEYVEVPVYIHEKDSVRTEYVERVRVDTVEVEITLPAQSAMQNVRDSVSHLETDLAISDARILEDGSLLHILVNKSGTLKGEGYVASKDTERIETEYKYKEVPVEVEKTITVTETEYVEKELTGWQQFRLDAFWWLVGLGILSLVWIFRSPLIKLTAKLIKT